MWRSVAAAALAGCVVAAQAPQALPRFDIVIRGDTVIDGTGGAPYRADVGVVGKYVARIGDLSRAEAATEIDATGLDVAPGFINIHSHASPAALSAAENMLTQGVTLEILNADGGGATDIRKQLADIAASGLALNIGANVGFNSAWPPKKRQPRSHHAGVQLQLAGGHDRTRSPITRPLRNRHCRPWGFGMCWSMG